MLSKSLRLALEIHIVWIRGWIKSTDYGVFIRSIDFLSPFFLSKYQKPVFSDSVTHQFTQIPYVNTHNGSHYGIINSAWTGHCFYCVNKRDTEGFGWQNWDWMCLVWGALLTKNDNTHKWNQIKIKWNVTVLLLNKKHAVDGTQVRTHLNPTVHLQDGPWLHNTCTYLFKCGGTCGRGGSGGDSMASHTSHITLVCKECTKGRKQSCSAMSHCAEWDGYISTAHCERCYRTPVLIGIQLEWQLSTVFSAGLKN